MATTQQKRKGAQIYTGLNGVILEKNDYSNQKIFRKSFQALDHIFRINGEVVIAFDYRAMGPNPFGFLLVPLRSTCGQNMSRKASEHFGYFPREILCHSGRPVRSRVCSSLIVVAVR